MNKTILHIACEKNVFSIVKVIIESLFEGEHPVQNSDESRSSVYMGTLQEYLNQQTSDGLTALHYASFRGNLEVIKYLTKLGANPFIEDKDGHNVIHIAAQGDKVNVIYYFLQNFNFDVNDEDHRKSTALHWAAYLNKEISLSYLIAWGANVNSKDTENNTPLHLAVVSSETVKESRCVKILLLKGSKRENENKNGQKAIDLVKNGYMKGELLSILKDTSYCTCMMLKVPLTKVERSPSTLVFFLFLLTFVVAGSVLFIYPLTGQFKQYYILS